MRTAMWKMPMRSVPMSRVLLAAVLAAAPLALLDAGSARAASPVGTVTSLSGSATAVGVDGAQRSLACGDAIQAGDQVEVSSDGEIGVLAGGSLAQLEGGSKARFDRTDAGAPSVDLEAGTLRMVDTRATGSPPLRIGVPGAVARGVGGDSEAHLLREKGGPYALLCEWGTPLEVSRPNGRERVVAKPGHCAVARAREPIYLANAQSDRVPLAERALCTTGPIAGPIADRFDPNQVAAAPPPSGLLAPAPPAFERTPCDTFRCGGRGGVGLGVIESPVTPGGLPGGSQPGGLPN
jgi:hypothetical protein